MPGDGVEIEIGEIQPFGTAVRNAFARQIAVQIHLSQSDGVRRGIPGFDRRHAADVAHVRHRRQATNRGFHSAAKIRGIHGVGNIQ
ncbi:hypothetical protein D3C72_1101790 [compost metagenome]